jgi:hypothetical protein
MVELSQHSDWEDAMCLCEEAVTLAVKGSNYGFISNRFNVNDRVCYTVSFSLMPVAIGKHSDVNLVTKRKLELCDAEENEPKKQKIVSSTVKRKINSTAADDENSQPHKVTRRSKQI